jgi:hypothetical protein
MQLYSTQMKKQACLQNVFVQVMLNGPVMGVSILSRRQPCGYKTELLKNRNISEATAQNF